MNILKVTCQFLLLSGVLASAGEVDVIRLKQELRILTKVLNTTFDDEERHSKVRALRPTNVKSLYLANQGVLLKVGVGRERNFMFDAPRPPHRVVLRDWSPDFDFDFDFDQMSDELGDMGDVVEDALESAMEAISDLDAPMHNDPGSKEMRREIREIAREQKEAMAELRERQREARGKLRDAKLSLQEREEMVEQAKKFKDNALETAKQIESRMGKLKQERKQAWDDRIVPFMTRFMETLCEFGGSLKSLPADQHLTVVFNKADRSGERPLDKIYVFSKADLMACRDGSISSEQLKTRASSYSY